MNETFLVTLNSSGERERVRELVGEVLAEYSDTMLVECSPSQYASLVDDDIECERYESPQLRGSRMAAIETKLTQLESNSSAGFGGPPVNRSRKCYYVAKFRGPIGGDLLKSIQRIKGTNHGSLPGNRLIIGLVPSDLEKLASIELISNIIPYVASLKIAPGLDRLGERAPDAGGLVAAPQDVDLQDADIVREGRSVEIAVFQGEGTAELSASIREKGGTVIVESPQSIRAIIPDHVIREIANREGVEVIAPFVQPELHNDVARTILSIPSPPAMAVALTGAGQVVAVADSGLDTGDLTNIHADFEGRLSAIESFPSTVDARFTHDPPSFDDGPADRNSGHGTHVAGSVLGDGSAASEIQAQLGNADVPIPSGAAPEANLVFQSIEQTHNWKSRAELAADGIPLSPLEPWPPRPTGLYGLPTDLNDLFQAAYDAGARIHTNSWGAAVAGAYTISSSQLDEFMWNNRDFVVLMSAGNEGEDANGNGVIDEGSIGSPGTAKNCVTVGATENQRPSVSTPPPGFDANWTDMANGFGGPRYPNMGAAGHVSDNPEGMAAFSSRGPTQDGRRKPDVVAPGTNVLSAKTSLIAGTLLWGTMEGTDPLFDAYCWSGGTSMSCPLVAGAVALIRQHLVDERGHHVDGVTPSGALLKAFLVNGCDFISGQFAQEIPAGANDVVGLGRVNVASSIGRGVVGQQQFSDDPALAVARGAIQRFNVQATVPDQPLKITLCWTDAPGSVALGGGLRNQLRLQVRLADGTVRSAEGSPMQVFNNVQQIVIENPGSDEIQVRVRGLSITRQSPHSTPNGGEPTQDFALVTSNTDAMDVV